MRLFAFLVILLFAFGLATFVGCNTGTAGNDSNTDNTNNNDDGTGDDGTGDGTGDDGTGDNGDGTTDIDGTVHPDHVVPEGQYVGAETCAFCHSRLVGYWGGTVDADGNVVREPSKHSTALEGLLSSDFAADECLACHTVGYGQEGGFSKTIEELRAEQDATTAGIRQDDTTTGTDDTATDGDTVTSDGPYMPDLGGVQCENCHGPGHDHALDPSASPMDTSGLLSADVCGQCHTDSHHPTFDEWETSAHAGALETIANNDHGGASCLGCHSVDYIELQNDIIVPEVGTASLVGDPTPAEFGLTCQTCHRVHSGSLREPAEELCIECHTMGTAAPGRTPHHSQSESLGGVGAYAADGTDLVGDAPAHAGVDGLCAGCHMFPSDYVSEEVPANTGHTWLIRLEGDQNSCAQVCHFMTGHTEPGTLVEERHAEINVEVAELTAYFTAASATYIDPATLDAAGADLYAKAKFNVEFVGADGSGGVHNPAYIDDALAAAREIFESL